MRIHDNTCRIVDVCVNEEDRWQQISQPGEIGIFLLAQTPLLVVEVTSTNENEEYEAKSQEYAAIGILEYWIVSSRRQQVRVCNLTQRNTTYQYRDFGNGERIVSRVLPQLSLTVDEVLAPPAVTQLMAQEPHLRRRRARSQPSGQRNEPHLRRRRTRSQPNETRSNGRWNSSKPQWSNAIAPHNPSLQKTVAKPSTQLKYSYSPRKTAEVWSFASKLAVSEQPSSWLMWPNKVKIDG